MPTADLADVEAVVHTIAEVAVANEKYFGDLDAVVGDGDFGYSMARGFELVLSGWADFDRADIGTFLKKIAVTITSRIGGTSGPIWGTAFLRAGAKAGTATELTRRPGRRDAARGDRGHQGARQVRRGRQDPARRPGPRHGHARGAGLGGEPSRGGLQGRRAGRPRAARRPRAACSPSAAGPPTPASESIGTLDAGAVAVAVMFEALAERVVEAPGSP